LEQQQPRRPSIRHGSSVAFIVVVLFVSLSGRVSE
jgi:hypothetical protein